MLRLRRQIHLTALAQMQLLQFAKKIGMAKRTVI